MTISTQTAGLIALTIMSVTALAVTADLLSHRSVSERMLYYQAEEIAMDIEIMWDWGEGSQVHKKFRNSYESISKTVENGESWIVLSTDDNTQKAPVNDDSGSFSVDSDVENVNCIRLEKTSSNTLEIKRPADRSYC